VPSLPFPAGRDVDMRETWTMDTSRLRQPAYWRSFAPSLHVDDDSFLRDVAPLDVPAHELRGLMSQLKEEGYFHQTANWGLDLKLMAETVRSLAKADLPPVFAFLYDEFWYPFYKLRSVYEGVLGGRYYFLPSCWVWNIDPAKGDSGWAPHRDMGRTSLFDDGSPKSITTWIPLSSATPLNGCMYIVPASHDPTYATAEEANWKLDPSSVRALPANPGDFLVWNQAVLHWGGKSSPRATESRVSMAFEFQRADVPPINMPLIDPTRIVPFETRLRLIGKQILQYQHMYKLEPNIARLASELAAGVPVVVAAGNGAVPAAARNADDPSNWGKVSRNEPCPCGSGKRYKQCHGRFA
jgi:hypothetical protein